MDKVLWKSGMSHCELLVKLIEYRIKDIDRLKQTMRVPPGTVEGEFLSNQQIEFHLDNEKMNLLKIRDEVSKDCPEATSW